MKTLFVFILAYFFFTGDNGYPGYTLSPNGIYSKFYTHSKNVRSPQYGEYITVKLVRKVNDSIVFDSRVTNPKEGTVEYRLDAPMYPSALETGMAMMHIGDSASFLVFTDSIIRYMPKDDNSMHVQIGQVVTFDVKLTGIRSKEEAEADYKKKYEQYLAEEKVKIEKYKKEEASTFSNYVKKNKIKVKPEKSGMYYVETLKGTGPNAKTGDMVTVKYVGKFMDGKVFDASDLHNGEPYTFMLGQKMVIPGWEEGISLMKKGGKATLIIPSKLAYDSIGVPDSQSGTYLIYPYTPLVFDVELVAIK